MSSWFSGDIKLTQFAESGFSGGSHVVSSLTRVEQVPNPHDILSHEEKDIIFPEHTQHTKRNDDKEPLAFIVDALVNRLGELGLDSLVDKKYFAKLKDRGRERELEFIFNCKYRIFRSNFPFLANMAYRGKGTDEEIAHRKPNSGQIHGFIFEDPLGFVLLGIVCGSTQWLPGTQHSAALAYGIKVKSREVFASSYPAQLSPQEYLGKAWDSFKDKTTVGGVMALYVTITSGQKVRMANLGSNWAGLYRDGELINATPEVRHDDGTPYHLCRTHGVFKPANCEDKPNDSQKFEWQAQEGDFLFVVSASVRAVLNPQKIFEYSTTFSKSAFSNDHFVAASIGIIRGARTVSEEHANKEMMAIAVKVV
ncbi:hypothetical protein JCM33374_g297 [Metschnikowia sp. JCM 33374]|nr:hypothetical protein JCM33374_g297 [Metschnikowia sp. JCM 33374]